MKPLNVLLIAAGVIALPALFVWRDSLSPKRHGLNQAGSKPEEWAAPEAAGSRMERGSHSELLQKLFTLEGESGVPKLSAEQLSVFVEKQKHSAASLLVAWQLGEDEAWLEEAAQRYPDDPRVALAKLGAMKEMNADAKEWIERLKQNDPGNAMGWCYDAMNLFKEGAPEAALAALAEAAKRGRFDAYSKKCGADVTEAYCSAGYDGLAAEALGMFNVRLPQAGLAQRVQQEALKQLALEHNDELVQDMLKLSKSVRGQDESQYLIMKLVASTMERNILNKLNGFDLVPGTEKFVVERLDELNVEKKLMRELTQKTSPLMSKMNDSELKQYMRRTTIEGELKAMQWLLNQHPEAK